MSPYLGEGAPSLANVAVNNAVQVLNGGAIYIHNLQNYCPGPLFITALVYSLWHGNTNMSGATTARDRSLANG